MIPCPGCHRHVRASETSCPFCATTLRAESSPIRASLGTFAFAATLALGSFACASNPSADGSESTTTSETETTAATMTQSSSESEGTGEETDDSSDPSLSFYAPSEDFSGTSECDPFQQDCPEGEKCVAYASEGGTWDANKCVPISGNASTGEACTYGGRVEASDDCDGDNYCFNVVDGVGVCTAFCEGNADVPVCDPGFECLTNNDGSINLCMQTCDPLAQDCPDPLTCTWADNMFMCIHVGESDAAVGEPCTDFECGPGSACVLAEYLIDCAGDACCAEYCDTSDMGFSCMQMGLECTPYFEDPPQGYETLGICIEPS